jgi:hypothetical protein
MAAAISITLNVHNFPTRLCGMIEYDAVVFPAFNHINGTTFHTFGDSATQNNVRHMPENPSELNKFKWILFERFN